MPRVHVHVSFFMDGSPRFATLFGGMELKSGAYIRPHFSSTKAVLVTPLLVPLSNRLAKIMHPAYSTTCAYVEPNKGRV